MAHSVPVPVSRRASDVGASRRPGSRWDVVSGAVRESRRHGLTTTARALAYSVFLAIPAGMLVVLGVFSLVADESDVARLVNRLDNVMPSEVASLVGDSLERTIASPRSGLVLTVVGLLLALWSTTSAATSLMQGITAAYDRNDERGLVRRRAVALVIVVFLVCAAAALFGLLVLGPHLARWLGDAIGEPTLTEWIWWTAQWPILVVVLLVSFAIVLYLGADVERKRWRLVTPGSVVALSVWLASSGALAYYSARFGSFEKTWGTLSAVVVTLIWLWLGAVALLFGAELDAQSERRRADRDEAERRL
jgi:membrane protein